MRCATTHSRSTCKASSTPNTLQRCYSEALLRMPDESTGRLLPPSQFIPYAEKSNLIIDIDRWTLNARDRASRRRPGDGADRREPLGTLGERAVDRRFHRAAAHGTAVDPARLFIEITETPRSATCATRSASSSACTPSAARSRSTTSAPASRPSPTSSSCPVDVLKIDGLFIRNLGKSRDNQVFVKAMLDIARGFNKLTVAEAVEDETCLDILRSYGVDMVQGFALERPQPATTSAGRIRRCPLRSPRRLSAAPHDSSLRTPSLIFFETGTVPVFSFSCLPAGDSSRLLRHAENRPHPRTRVSAAQSCTAGTTATFAFGSRADFERYFDVSRRVRPEARVPHPCLCSDDRITCTCWSHQRTRWGLPE
jgi:EAL domain-containing protein (putative c-di-GMP-specific phosphodiesterase class I)